MKARKPLRNMYWACLCLRRKERRRTEVAIHRIEKELDIVNFVKLQKFVRITNRFLLSDIERYLLRNQQCFVINSENSTSRDESEDDFTTEQIKNASK